MNTFNTTTILDFNRLRRSSPDAAVPIAAGTSSTSSTCSCWPWTCSAASATEA